MEVARQGGGRGRGARRGGRIGGRGGRGRGNLSLNPYVAAPTQNTNSRPTSTIVTRSQSSVVEPAHCSHCNGKGHSDRDCKDNVLKQLEKQRLRREAMEQRIRRMDDGDGDGDDNEVVLCVGFTQDGEETQQSHQSSSAIGDDGEFISILEGLGED